MTYIRLNVPDLALPALLLVLNGALSVALGLGLERQLAAAALRMIVQLALVGYVLRILFELASPFWIGGAALVMVVAAAHEIAARQARPFAGGRSFGLGAGCALIVAGSVTALALLTQIRPDPWYSSRYALPLLGMVLGNTMTGIALGLDALTTGALRDRAAVEARLALGATRHAAMQPVMRAALRAGFMPIINSMAAAGLVSLPGMMTGQILAGAEPVDAAKYQILVMFLIAGGTGLGTVAAVLGGIYLLSDRRHRLRLDRLGAAPSSST
ncbi:MAG TPA: iron export ABC transporter permease subunit FetB [Crenalkalicoccus sp.]|jgi:putative ABC transport system permease protein|nr:iron export ABC transporter permease subunit FetB [Crenalkalicoccus sp.]